MTVFYGANATKRDVTIPSVKIDPGEVNAPVRVAYDEYTLTAASLTTSDSLRLMKIPQGARVLDLVIDAPDLGGSGTMNVGWLASSAGGEAANATGFHSALDLSGQAQVVSLIEATSAAGLHKKFTEEVQVVMVPAANFSATSGTIKVSLTFAWY